MKKNLSTKEKLERKQKAAAIGTCAAAAALGALTAGTGIALAATAAAAGICIGGIFAALAGFAMMACAYPLYMGISGAKYAKA